MLTHYFLKVGKLPVKYMQLYLELVALLRLCGALGDMKIGTNKVPSTEIKKHKCIYGIILYVVRFKVPYLETNAHYIVTMYLVLKNNNLTECKRR